MTNRADPRLMEEWMIVYLALVLRSCSITGRTAFTITVAEGVGMEAGGQNIGPTSIIILCDLVGC